MTSETLAVVTVLVGAAIPFLSEWLNGVYNLHKEKALLVVAALAALVSVAVLLLGGKLQVTELTASNFVPVFTLVYSTANVVFNLIVKNLKWEVKTDNWVG